MADEKGFYIRAKTDGLGAVCPAVGGDSSARAMCLPKGELEGKPGVVSCLRNARATQSGLSARLAGRYNRMLWTGMRKKVAYPLGV